MVIRTLHAQNQPRRISEETEEMGRRRCHLYPGEALCLVCIRQTALQVVGIGVTLALTDPLGGCEGYEVVVIVPLATGQTWTCGLTDEETRLG